MRLRRDLQSGSVLEIEIFPVSNRTKDIDKVKPKLQTMSQEERDRHKHLISRRLFIRKFNHNFSPSSLYTTLTLNNEYEVHTFSEAKKLLDNYINRLIYLYPDAKVMAVMGRGKKTNRIHFHIVSDGISAIAIRSRWVEGDVVRIESLREDNYYNGKNHGRDYTGLAGYLFDHWTPEQGTRKYRETRKTIEKPKPETEQTEKKHYLKKPPSVPKGYKIVEARAGQYGYLYFKAVKIIEKVKKKQTPQRM